MPKVFRVPHRSGRRPRAVAPAVPVLTVNRSAFLLLGEPSGVFVRSHDPARRPPAALLGNKPDAANPAEGIVSLDLDRGGR